MPELQRRPLEAAKLLLQRLRYCEHRFLLDSGRISQPADATDLAEDAPLDYGVDASETLRSMRDNER